MKKIVCMALVLTMALSPLAAGAEPLARSAAAPSWAAGAYDHLEENYVLNAGSPTSGPIDRGHFLALLVDTLHGTVPPDRLDAVDLEPYYNYFADNYLDFAMSMEMVYAAAYGIAEGSLQGDRRYGRFDDTLTRQEAAKMVCSALDFFTDQGYEVQPAGAPAVFADAASIASWAAPYTGRIAAYQIMEGDQNGSFGPAGELDWPSAVVLVSRTLTLLEDALAGARAGVVLHSQMDWSTALHVPDYQVSRPLTGYALGYYAIDNGDGTLSALTVAPIMREYDEGPEYILVPPEHVYVESYDAQGNVTASKSIPMELPIWGGFLDGGDNFYLAFGQENQGQDDGREVWRVVQYDRDWRRVAAASVNGGESHTCLPYEATVSRMALSPDGETLALYAARERYADGSGIHHQSNITITVDTDGMRVRSVSKPYPDEHVSHSFGQFVQYDGKKLVTVDHGDAYPRSFVLQDGSRKLDLLQLYGPTGENKTHAIGSGLEVTDSGYLFLGCSAPQDGTANSDTPWNVFLAYTGRSGGSAQLTWLTTGEADIRCARLVKLSDSELVALWGVDGDVHYQRLDGRGRPVGDEGVLEGAAMPTTQPVVRDGVVRWIGVYESQTNYGQAQAALFALEP